MARIPKSKTLDQYSSELSIYRGIAPYSNLNVIDGDIWRNIARSQPIVMDCITALSMKLQALPFSVRAKDSNRSDELKEEVDYYLDIFKNCQSGDGFQVLVDSVLQDLYTTPFGGAIETVRYADGRLYTFKTVDSATMFLSNDVNMPYYQHVPEALGKMEPVYYSRDEMLRIYQSPRNELRRRGWQIPPVEKAYLSIEMLNRGDKYYANLLLDTPEAGLLDLGDMSKESAEAWLKSFRDMFTGVDAFKIPVLFEHTTQAKYIPFGRPPTDLMFGEIGIKYAQVLVAAFGLTLGDIGLKASNGSLSSDIRDERHSKSTGYASAKTLITAAMNRMLPDYLEFWFIDVDDELLVSKGRARSANAVAMRNMIEAGMISPPMALAQMKADGLMTIPLPESTDPEDFQILKEINGMADQVRLQEAQMEIDNKAPDVTPDGTKNTSGLHIKGGQAGQGLTKVRNLRGGKLESVQGRDVVPPSQGGQGEIKRSVAEDVSFLGTLQYQMGQVAESANRVRVKRILRKAYQVLKETSIDKSEIQRGSDAVTPAGEEVRKFTKKDLWYLIFLDDDYILNEFIRSFSVGLQQSAQEMVDTLYEHGRMDEYLNVEISLQNQEIIDWIKSRISFLKTSINEGTEFYISRLAILSLSEIYDQYDEDTAVEMALDLFNELFKQTMQDRASVIADFETQKMYNAGRLAQYEKVGLTKKITIHIGNDEPCEMCVYNGGLGSVPIDHLYADKFGGQVDAAPFHLHCHCVTTYDKRELLNKEDIGSSTFYFGD